MPPPPLSPSISNLISSFAKIRETLYPILQSRVGPDQFVSRILRLREDPRFRSVGPNVLEMIDDDETLEELGEEEGLWFDYVFVEFLKTNYSKLLSRPSELKFAEMQKYFLTFRIVFSIGTEINFTRSEC